MKFLSLDKNNGCLVVVKKTKEFMSIDSAQGCIDFLHKKNPNKGKISARNLIGPIQFEKNNYWILYYTAPLNKNSTDSDWTFIINNKRITTFNGIMIIKNKNSGSLSNLFNTVDFELDEIESLKKTLISPDETKSTNDEFQENDGDEDDIEEDEVESFAFNNFSENLEDEDDKINDELFDDDIDIDEKNVFNSSPKEIEELEIEQTHALEFENYSYMSEIIPVGA
tara:strand:- start:395 stop:1069 length:675 start_codon:yes stop_codon:yes gene_type:complete